MIRQDLQQYIDTNELSAILGDRIDILQFPTETAPHNCKERLRTYLSQHAKSAPVISSREYFDLVTQAVNETIPREPGREGMSHLQVIMTDKFTTAVANRRNLGDFGVEIKELSEVNHQHNMAWTK